MQLCEQGRSGTPPAAPPETLCSHYVGKSSSAWCKIHRGAKLKTLNVEHDIPFSLYSHICGFKWTKTTTNFSQRPRRPQLMITETAEVLNQSNAKHKKIKQTHRANQQGQDNWRQKTVKRIKSFASAAPHLWYKQKSFYFVNPLLRRPLPSPFVPGGDSPSNELRRRGEVEGLDRSTVM